MSDSFQTEDPADIARGHQVRQNRSLRWMMLSIALLMLCMATADQLLAPPGESRSFIWLSMCSIALLSYLLLRSRRSRLDALLLVSGSLLLSAWAVYSYGSVRSASTFAFLGVVVVAGSYLSLRALWATTFAGVLLIGVLTWAEISGYMGPMGLRADARNWLMGSVIVLMIGVQLYQTRKVTEEVYLRHLNQAEERLRMEHERDESMRRLRRIFELNPTALLVLTAGTRAVLEVNPAFERSYGYRSDQVIGDSARAFWADKEQWRAHIRTLYDKGRTDWQPVLWRRADGSVLDVLVCSELNEDVSGPLVLTTVVDMPSA